MRENAEKDPKNKKKILSGVKFPTTMMESSSIELLLTTRYIDEDQAFFKKFVNIRFNLIAVNNHVSSWSSGSSRVERWILRGEKRHSTVFKSYGESIKYLVEKYIV